MYFRGENFVFQHFKHTSVQNSPSPHHKLGLDTPLIAVYALGLRRSRNSFGFETENKKIEIKKETFITNRSSADLSARYCSRETS